MKGNMLGLCVVNTYFPSIPAASAAAAALTVSFADILRSKRLDNKSGAEEREKPAVLLVPLGIVGVPARVRLEEAVSLQREVGDRHYLANALNNLGNVARDQGDHPAASPSSRNARRRIGSGWGRR